MTYHYILFLYVYFKYYETLFYTHSFIFNIQKCFSEVFFSAKELSNIYMQPSIDSPIIYPIELGKKLILKKNQDEWANVLDEKTGLVGWIQKDCYQRKNQKIRVKVMIYESFSSF